MAVLDMPVTPIDPVPLREGTDYTRGTLPTGPVIGVVNDRNALFDAEHTYDVGRGDDKFVCLAREVLKVSGAGSRTAEQTSRALHELGLVVRTSCGKTESSISLSGIDNNLDAGMALLREWLASPAFDDTTVKATVAQALTERANAKANPRSIAGAQAQFARYGAESDLLVVASNKDLENITAAQLKKTLASFLRWKHRTAYFGPRPANDVAAAIVLGDGKVATTPRKPVRFRAPNVVLATDQATAQTQIWLIWPRKPANDADRAAGTLFSAYVGPVLFQEVREARGLAYTVRGGYGAGGRKADDASAFAFVGTQADKTHDSLDAVIATMRGPIDETRLALAKESLAQDHRVDRVAPRAIADVVYSWQDQGETSDPRDARVKRALDLDRAKLEAWAKAALAAPMIVSITGDRKKLDEAKLQKLAPVTFVPVDKLFGY
jgi:predicted Zn-dependent peptidase